MKNFRYNDLQIMEESFRDSQELTTREKRRMILYEKTLKNSDFYPSGTLKKLINFFDPFINNENRAIARSAERTYYTILHDLVTKNISASQLNKRLEGFRRHAERLNSRSGVVSEANYSSPFWDDPDYSRASDESIEKIKRLFSRYTSSRNADVRYEAERALEMVLDGWIGGDWPWSYVIKEFRKFADSVENSASIEDHMYDRVDFNDVHESHKNDQERLTEAYMSIIRRRFNA